MRRAHGRTGSMSPAREGSFKEPRVSGVLPCAAMVFLSRVHKSSRRSGIRLPSGGGTLSRCLADPLLAASARPPPLARTVGAAPRGAVVGYAREDLRSQDDTLPGEAIVTSPAGLGGSPISDS